jgi:hypothetical protein
VKCVGLDCHQEYDHAPIINTETGKIKTRRLAPTADEFRRFIGGKTDSKMVIESCWNWGRTY